MWNKIYRLAALLGWLATVTGQAQNMPTPPVYGALTNNNTGNVTFNHALTIGSGTPADVLTVNGRIFQLYGVGGIANAFNNGAWYDNGQGAITCSGLTTTTLNSHSIQNSYTFNSDAGSFYSDGIGNINVQSLTALGAITNDNGDIYSDGAGTLYASKFNGDGGLETNIVWSRSFWNFNPTPQLSPYYIVMGLTQGTQTSATRAVYPTVGSEIIPKAGILSLMITIQNGTGAGGAGSNIYIFACSNGVVLSPPALTIPISSLPYLTPITYTATNYTTWAGGTNLLSLILSNNSTTSVTGFTTLGFTGAIQVR